jgi:hypothetical protein
MLYSNHNFKVLLQVWCLRIYCGLSLGKSHVSYNGGTGVAWLSVGAHKRCRQTFATLTQLPAETATGASRSHAERGTVSVGIAASRTQRCAEQPPQIVRMQPMALQFSSNLTIQEAVQDSHKETLETYLSLIWGIAAMWELLWKCH